MQSIDDLRIRQLFEQANLAFSSGRPVDGERMLRQAQSEAPQHPLVLNETARRKLMTGDPAGASALLQAIVETHADYPAVWMNLAAATRALSRPDDEMTALQNVLRLEPANFRALLQAATLYEMRGDSRTAAATYRTALMNIPRGLPPDLRPVLDQAQASVRANDRALETFLEGYLQDPRGRHDNEPLGRFDRCLDTLLQKKPIFRPQPSFMYFPYLPGFEFYDRGEFPWLDAIEAATDDIRAELIQVLAGGQAELEPYVSISGAPEPRWRELNNSRRWGVFYLWKAGAEVAENMARCPKTTQLLRDHWPRCDLKGTAPTAVFSILDAKTRIPPHVGVNNARLIVHLPLIVPPGCGFRVGGETRGWDPGRAFVFDDTIEHEAWNDSPDPRAVLIFDIWNPYVTQAEREMVSALTAGVDEYYGQLPGFISGAPI